MDFLVGQKWLKTMKMIILGPRDQFNLRLHVDFSGGEKLSTSEKALLADFGEGGPPPSRGENLGVRTPP